MQTKILKRVIAHLEAQNEALRQLAEARAVQNAVLRKMLQRLM